MKKSILKINIWKIGRTVEIFGAWIKRMSGHNPTRRNKAKAPAKHAVNASEA